MELRFAPMLVILALYAPAASTAADLRVGLTRYEGGAAAYGMAENQQLICDKCPQVPDLVLAPPRSAIRYEPREFSQTLQVSELPQEHCGAPLEVMTPPAAPPRITVFFGFNKAQLSANEKRKIREALAAGLDPSVVVRVDGYTCRVGSQEYNRKLSARRAKAVASYLRALGVKVSSVEGLGEKHRKGAVLPKDRRAEILIRERN